VIARVEQSDRRVKLIVHDTGRGIAADFLPFVWDRFRQGEGSRTSSRAGLGLGLALVRHLVELHGGIAEVHSDGRGKGAVFTITLPVQLRREDVPEEAPSSAVPLSATLERELEGVRVLIVDDELDTRDLFDRAFVAAGALTHTAASADEALGAVDRFRPDVLVADIGLPGRDGHALVRELCAFANVPAIAVTAYASAKDEAAALSSGFARHVAKPVDPGRLVRIVASVLDE